MTGQISLFDAPREPFPQEDIDRALCRGGVTEGGAGRILRHFRTHPDLLSRVEFLKEEYGVSGSLPVFLIPEDPDRQFGADYNSREVKFFRYRPQYEEKRMLLSQVAKRISYLIDIGQFVDLGDED